VFTVTGLWLSYRYNLTSGASIIMVSGVAFLLSLLIEQIRFTTSKGAKTARSNT
jgi:zinc transport system permease protein